MAAKKEITETGGTPRRASDSRSPAGGTERPSLRIRWWVLPLAIVLCAVQTTVCLFLESSPTEIGLNTTQIPVTALGFLMVLALVINPLLRKWAAYAERRGWRAIKPFNRGEIMTLVAALAVTSLTGVGGRVISHITAPFNADWNTPQSKLNVDVIPHLKKSLYITDPAEVLKWRTGAARMQGSFLAGLRQVPWGVWIKPLCLWLSLVLAIYLIYYSLALLFFDSWSRQEKLIFPLARLPEALLTDEGAEDGAWSSTFRSGFFWFGFVAVLALVSYNGACEAGWMGGLQPLTYGIKQPALQGMIDHSIFRGIAGRWHFGLTFEISFVAIGIAFLLPLEISLSLWVYEVFALFLFMVAIWTAAGASVENFYSDRETQNNFVSALGAGGLLAFAGVYLVKIGLSRWPERNRNAGALAALWSVSRWEGVLFLFSLGAAAAWYVWSGVSPACAAGYLLIEVLITISLMRLVAEGGVYWISPHLSAFHIARMIGGSQELGGGNLARLVMADSSTMSPPTSPAPAALNALKLEEEGRAARRRFHLAVILSVLVSLVASVVFILYLSYQVGANRMNEWSFTGSPRQALGWAQGLAKVEIVPQRDLNWMFYLLGAAWVVLSMGMRRRFFWWLHPIGFVMICSRSMRPLWFPFFIGWLCKSLVVRYGGRHSFARLRPLFLGFIFADVMGALIWAFLAWKLGLEHVGIDIFDRMWP